MVFAADQVLKAVFKEINEEILSDFFELTYKENTGIIFGLDVPLIFSIIFSIALLAAGIILVNKYFDLSGFLARFSAGLVLGGAIGNLFDRFIHGYVIDYISISVWPVFNFADIAIFIGAVVIFVKFDKLLLKHYK